MKYEMSICQYIKWVGVGELLFKMYHRFLTHSLHDDRSVYLFFVHFKIKHFG